MIASNAVCERYLVSDGYMTTIDVLVKNAPSRNLVSERKPPAAPPDPYAVGCPTRMLLDRIGDKWMVLTLSLIRDKPRRFNALRREIEGVTQKMLSQTLKQMERDGLVTRTVLPTTPVSVEYSITPLGQTLAAVLDGLQLWARDHIADVLASRRLYDGSGRG
jgi:DNA-binding HxlR family transcriptional regulator